MTHFAFRDTVRDVYYITILCKFLMKCISAREYWIKISRTEIKTSNSLFIALSKANFYWNDHFYKHCMID